MSAADPKDVVYIDVDEEITSIVSKVQGSSKDIVALVLPKRAAVLQSIVNMKLLKRASEQNDKQVVLITSEARLLPLAGAAGLFVAPNLTSKPYVPPTPVLNQEKITDANQADKPVDPKTPVSEVAPDAKFADDENPLEIDNTAKKTPEDAPKRSGKGKSAGGKKIPNFSRFRKKLIIGAVVAGLLIGGLVYAFFFAPKAKIILKTQSEDVVTSIDFVADPNATEFNEQERIIPAQVKEVEKTDQEKVETTGEKNVGEKATGTVTLKNCKFGGKATTIAAGTGVSADGFTFITNGSVNVPVSEFRGPDCISKTSSVSVTAQDPGEDYNLSARSYSVSGTSGIQATGSAMKGGTDKNVKTVSQKDVDLAKERLSGKQNTVKDEISKEFSDAGYVAIPDTFKASDATYSPSPGVGSESNEVTVSSTAKYTMMGVKKDDLKKLIEEDVKDEKTGDQQALLNDGIDNGKFNISTAIGQLEEGQLRINFQGTAVLGPEINEDQLKQELAGKRKGPAEDLLKTRPGIIEPTVELSPFWVSSIPGKASRVTFEIQQADGSSVNQ